MARQKGAIKFSGTIGDIVFYKTRFGYFARANGSLNGRTLKKDKRYARGMENSGEFTQAISCGYAVRNAIRHLLKDACDSYLSSRMNKLFTRVLKLDTGSARGKRHPGIALGSTEGKAMLRGFDFNAGCLLSQIIKKKAIVSGDDLVIADLHLIRDIQWPKGANGVELKCCITDIDLQGKKFTRYNTNTVVLIREGIKADVLMSAGGLPAVAGNRLYVLRCGFFQERNGSKYYLKDKKYNALKVVEVI